MARSIPPNATADEGITNTERALWAETALMAFGRRIGAASNSIGDKEDPFLIVADLLADLAHWCDRNDVSLQSALEYATRHYMTETSMEGKQLDTM
ncbi:MAG: hypothetical protein ACXV7C_09105 [Candidatus Angelobacter sp.]